LNASVSMKSIQEAIDGKLEQVVKDLAVIDSLPSYAFEAREYYIDTLDLARAVSEAHRLQEQAEKKAAWEAEQQKRKEEAANANEAFKKQVTDYAAETVEAEVIEPSRQWIGFQALLSADEAKALGAWLRGNGIRYKAI
jgi:NADH:ubiquinone oxidoreductase subunit D